MSRSAALLLVLVTSALAVAGWLEVFRMKGGAEAGTPRTTMADAAVPAPGEGWTKLVEGLSNEEEELFRLQEQIDILREENTRLHTLTRQASTPAVPDPAPGLEPAPAAPAQAPLEASTEASGNDAP